MSQQQAQNIITYVGVPLAVLGVLPTLSTTLQSILTQRAVRRSLHENGVHALTRSSLLSGIIEIEISRLSIQPLDRNDPAYWKVRTQRSSLRGGSWTIFYWAEMAIGSKSYRLQYHDELVQPQAEIGFEALIAFLLDRGAVPCQQGLADLRGSGLWTPVGTKLLLSPVTNDPVLIVARSDDSDGILSLSLAWEPEWDRPQSNRLSPYWVRLRSGKTSRRKIRKVHLNLSTQAKGLMEKEDVDNTSEASLDESQPPSAIRIRVSANGVEEACDEETPKHSVSLPQFRNADPHNAMAPGCLWFNIACTALTAPSGGLWSFAIPAAYISFSQRDSFPCGILVSLGLLTNSEVPAWPSSDALDRIEQEEEQNERHQRAIRTSQRMMKEIKMKPEDAAIARQERMRDDMMAMQDERNKERFKAERRKEKYLSDAIASPRLGATIVGEAARKWLIKEEQVDAEIGATVAGVVEKTLYDMTGDDELANAVADVLENWKAWTEGGGMTRTNFDDIGSRLNTFCRAACILALVKETSAHPTGNVASDLQECLRIWQRVRLG